MKTTPEENSPVSVTQSTFASGQKLAGVFVLRRQLEAQGADPIWLAHDEVLGKDVSLQFLPPEIRKDDRAMAELRQEIKKHRQLIHPGILRIYDLVEEAEWAAISMDYFEGDSLAHLISKKEGQFFEPAEIEPWLRSICQTLDEVHRIQVVHRNICPENLWVDNSGKLILARFGISRVLEDARGRLHGNDAAGERHLTYVSPQQLDGEAPNRLDDIYALGATLFELAAGEPPFSGADLVSQIRRAAPGSIGERRAKLNKNGAPVPGGWEKAVAAALAKTPADRPQSAGELFGKLGGAGKSGDQPAPLAGAAVSNLSKTGSGDAGAEKAGVGAPASKGGEKGSVAAAASAATKLAAKQSAAKSPARGSASADGSGWRYLFFTTLIVGLGMALLYYFNLPSESPGSKESASSATPAPAESSEPPPTGAPVNAVAPDASAPAEVAAAKPDDAQPAKPAAAEAPADAKVPADASPAGAVAANGSNLKLQTGEPTPLIAANGTSAPAATPAPAAAATPAATPAPAVAKAPAATSAPVATSTPASTKAPAVAAVPSPKATATTAGPTIAITGAGAPGVTVATNVSPAAIADRVAASPTPKPTGKRGRNAKATPTPTPVAATGSGVVSGDVEKVRKAAADAEKAYQAKLKEKQEAEAAAAALQRTVDEKSKAAAPVLKAVEALTAEQQKREEQLKAAEAAARDSRKLAEDQMKIAEKKARDLEDAKSAMMEWSAQNKTKLAGKDKTEAEIQSVKDQLTAKQRAAADLAKAVIEAEAASKAQTAALKNAESAAEQARLAAAEAERKAVEERAHKRDQIKEEMEQMRKAFEQKMKDFESKMQTLEANKEAPAAHPTPAPTAPPAAKPAPAATPAAAPVATPAPPTANVPKPPPPPQPIGAGRPQDTAAREPLIALPAKESAASPEVPAIAAPPLELNPAAPLVLGSAPTTEPVAVLAMKTEPNAKPPQIPPGDSLPGRTAKAAFENSLGIRFAPVGDVYFAIWPVRVQDFEVFAKETNFKPTAWRSPGYKQGPDHPVVNVSWNDAIAFCKWLTDREHKKNALAKDQIYRLPTDLEWSRGVGLPEETGRTPEARDMGVPDVFPWGSQWPPPPNAGNYTGEETGSDVAIRGYDDGYAWTSPVGSFPANRYGLFDMGGNVWQWCMDSWNPDSKAKVLRGASWYNGALKLSLLSSCRVHANPESSTDDYGFRIVRATETGKPIRK